MADSSSSSSKPHTKQLALHDTTWTQKMTTYAAIEILLWFPALAALCYTANPTVRIYNSKRGKQIIDTTAHKLRNLSPTLHASVAKLSNRVYSSDRGRTFAEWLLLNKILAPVSFPAKLWISHRIVERRAAARAEATRATPLAPCEASPS